MKILFNVGIKPKWEKLTTDTHTIEIREDDLKDMVTKIIIGMYTESVDITYCDLKSIIPTY